LCSVKQLTSAPSRSAPAERPDFGIIFYLVLIGLVAAAIIGVFFGIAISLLTQPKDRTVVGAVLVSPAAEEAVITRGTTNPSEPRATTEASAKTALAPDSTLPVPVSSALTDWRVCTYDLHPMDKAALEPGPEMAAHESVRTTEL